MKNFNTRVMGIFSANGTDYDAMNNLMQDVALGREIYDAESDRVISKAEASAKILDFSRQVLGITDVKDAKQVRRALRDNGRDWFDIIEDTVDKTIEVGLKNSDWFNELVESKSISYGDRQDFVVTTNDALLSVAKAGTSHNDHILQRLKAGQTITIPTELYVVKVGADINKYILGDVEWDKLINAIAKAFEVKIQEQCYAEIAATVATLPSQFKGTGTLVKANFDNIIEAVSAANDGAEVVIMGTKSALSKITAIADVNWAATAQKDNMMNSGLIGIYEGTRLVTIPNRYKDATLSQFVFPTNQLFIMPVIGDEGKFIKYVEEGDTQILEWMDRKDYLSDIQAYQVSRRWGVGVVLGRYFGNWTI
jgi:hypothetical protein